MLPHTSSDPSCAGQGAGRHSHHEISHQITQSSLPNHTESNVVITLHQVRRALAKVRANMVMKLLGLSRCADTVVGNEKIRGVR